MVAVGYSQNGKTVLAVREALERSGAGAGTSWLFVLAARRHAPEEVLAAIRQQHPGLPVYGGSSVGAIVNDQFGYSGYEIVIAAMDAEYGPPRVKLAAPLEDAEQEAGRSIGAWLAGEDVRQAMLFYDVTRDAGGINVGSFLLDGIYEEMPEDHQPILFGAGLLADFPVTSSYLIVDGEMKKNAAMAIAVPPALEARVRVMHGCAPVSGVMEVTRADGARVLELDGEPAAHRLRAIAGSEDIALPFSVLLGRRSGDLLNRFIEREFINRLIIDVDERDGSIGLFEADIRQGDKVQVMARDNQLLLESVAAGVDASLKLLGDSEPEFAMYIDCAGRASVFTGSEQEEAQELVQHLDGRCPLIGFYAGREIAPFAGRSRPLDWTGVLVTFTRRAEGD